MGHGGFHRHLLGYVFHFLLLLVVDHGHREHVLGDVREHGDFVDDIFGGAREFVGDQHVHHHVMGHVHDHLYGLGYLHLDDHELEYVFSNSVDGEHESGDGYQLGYVQGDDDKLEHFQGNVHLVGYPGGD